MTIILDSIIWLRCIQLVTAANPVGDGSGLRLVLVAELLALIHGFLLYLFPVLAKYVVQLAISQREVLVHFLFVIFGNFLPLFRYDFHYLLCVLLWLVLFYDFSTLLGEEKVRTKRFPGRLHIYFDLLLLFLKVCFGEVTVPLVPELALPALLKGLQLGFGSQEIIILILLLSARLLVFLDYFRGTGNQGCYFGVASQFFFRVRFRIPDLNGISFWSLILIGGNYVSTGADLNVVGRLLVLLLYRQVGTRIILINLLA